MTEENNTIVTQWNDDRQPILRQAAAPTQPFDSTEQVRAIHRVVELGLIPD